MTIKEMKKEAKDYLKGNWGMSIATWLIRKLMISGCAILVILSFLQTPFFGFLVLLASLIFLVLPLSVGFSWMFLGLVDGRQLGIRDLFNGFKNYWKVIEIVLLKRLLLTLWLLMFFFFGVIFLFISMIIQSVIMLHLAIIILVVGLIAGFVCFLIKGISYSQTIYILNDKPTIGVTEAIKESKRLMSGNKGKYFLMRLSFLLWHLPTVLLSTVGMTLMLTGFVNAMSLFIQYHPYRPTLSIHEVMPVVIGIILLAVMVVYDFIVSFYIIPYSRATRAVFYRRLASLVKGESGEVLDETALKG